MLFDYWDAIRGFFGWVAESAAIMMVLSGLMAITWLGFERKRRGSFFKRKSEGESVVTVFLRIFLRILSYLGLILGVFVIWSGVMSLILDIPPSAAYANTTADEAHHFTSIFLIVIGIAIFFKPITMARIPKDNLNLSMVKTIIKNGKTILMGKIYRSVKGSL